MLSNSRSFTVGQASSLHKPTKELAGRLEARPTATSLA